jgi:hypothetical protein
VLNYHFFFVSSNTFGNTLYSSFAAPTVLTVAVAMKKSRDIVQYFNKSTQATKKLKGHQQESLLTKYSGQPKNILQDVKTRWWSLYCMLKRLQFLQEAIFHYIVDSPEEADLVIITAQKWKIYYQIEITLKTTGVWQRVLEGEKYVTGFLVPVNIYTIRQSFLQVIASQAPKQVVKQLTRILLNGFDWHITQPPMGIRNTKERLLLGMIIGTFPFTLIF